MCWRWWWTQTQKGSGKDCRLKDVNFKEIHAFFNQETGIIDHKVITHSIIICCSYCFQVHKIVKYVCMCSTHTAMDGLYTEFKGDTVMLGHVL